MAEISSANAINVDAARQPAGWIAPTGQELDPTLTLVAINQTLAARGRTDLSMMEATRQIAAASPDEVINQYGPFNNFAISFKMLRSWSHPPQLLGEAALAEVVNPIALADIHKHMALPRIRSADQHYDLINSGEFPALAALSSHACRPAYLRMLHLYTDFTIDLTTDISTGPTRQRIAERKQDIYRAYTIMSQLIDVTDLYALRSDGSVDDVYLCH